MMKAFPPCDMRPPFVGFVPPRDEQPLAFYDNDETVARLHDQYAHQQIPSVFSVDVFGEVFARRLDGLWLAQQLGAHEAYAPHRVQTLPCGYSVYEAEMLLQMHTMYPAPLFACINNLPALRALFSFEEEQGGVTYDQVKKAVDDFYFAFFAWLAVRSSTKKRD